MSVKRRFAALAGVAVSALALSGCAAPGAGGPETCDALTEVTWLNTIKIEIQEQFRAAVDDYNAVNTIASLSRSSTTPRASPSSRSQPPSTKRVTHRPS